MLEQDVILGNGNALLHICQYQECIPWLDIKQVPDALGNDDLPFLTYPNSSGKFTF